jgi:hypothetical protein
MFLACIELSGRDATPTQNRVLQLKFAQLETARIWAEQEAARHADATGRAVVFEISGPFMSAVWEYDGDRATAPAVEAGEPLAFAEDTLAPRA